MNLTTLLLRNKALNPSKREALLNSQYCFWTCESSKYRQSI